MNTDKNQSELMANNEQHCKLMNLFLRHKNPKSLTINDNEGTHMKSNAIQGKSLRINESEWKTVISNANQ